MARPALGNLTPGVTVSVSGGNRTVNGGDPNLDPFRAKTADLGLEWYFAEESLLSLAWFYKDIDTFVQTSRETRPYNTSGLPDSLLIGTGALPTDDFPSTSRSTPRAATCAAGSSPTSSPSSSCRASGSDFGMQFNYTYVDSEIQYVTSAGVPSLSTDLTGLSKNAYNAHPVLREPEVQRARLGRVPRRFPHHGAGPQQQRRGGHGRNAQRRCLDVVSLERPPGADLRGHQPHRRVQRPVGEFERRPRVGLPPHRPASTCSGSATSSDGCGILRSSSRGRHDAGPASPRDRSRAGSRPGAHHAPTPVPDRSRRIGCGPRCPRDWRRHAELPVRRRGHAGRCGCRWRAGLRLGGGGDRRCPARAAAGLSASRSARGRWHEKLVIDRPAIELVGDPRGGSVLSFDAAAGQRGPDGQPWGTWGCASVTVRAPDFRARDLTHRECLRLRRQPGAPAVRGHRTQWPAGGRADAGRRQRPRLLRPRRDHRSPGHPVRRRRAQPLPRLRGPRQRGLHLRRRQRALRGLRDPVALPAGQGTPGLRRRAEHAVGPGRGPGVRRMPADPRAAGAGPQRGAGARLAAHARLSRRPLRRPGRGRRRVLPRLLDRRARRRTRLGPDGVHRARRQPGHVRAARCALSASGAVADRVHCARRHARGSTPPRGTLRRRSRCSATGALAMPRKRARAARRRRAVALSAAARCGRAACADSCRRGSIRRARRRAGSPGAADSRRLRTGRR